MRTSKAMSAKMAWLERLISEGAAALRLRTDLEYFAETALKLRPKAGPIAQLETSSNKGRGIFITQLFFMLIEGGRGNLITTCAGENISQNLRLYDAQVCLDRIRWPSQSRNSDVPGSIQTNS